MKASEALKISNESTPLDWIEQIYIQIKLSANKGNISLEWYVPRPISIQVIDLLKKDGYKVSFQQTTNTNNALISISWN